jgi:hypothetical protein
MHSGIIATTPSAVTSACVTSTIWQFVPLGVAGEFPAPGVPPLFCCWAIAGLPAGTGDCGGVPPCVDDAGDCCCAWPCRMQAGISEHTSAGCYQTLLCSRCVCSSEETYIGSCISPCHWSRCCCCLAATGQTCSAVCAALPHAWPCTPGTAAQSDGMTKTRNNKTL